MQVTARVENRIARALKQAFPSLGKKAIIFFGLLLAQSAFSQYHHLAPRSASYTKFFFTQGVQGEKAQMTVYSPETGMPSTETWKGKGYKTSIGLEMMKFFHIGASHTFFDLQRQSSALAIFKGSRISIETFLVFQSPILNLSLGGGVMSSSGDHYELGKSSDVNGFGHFGALKASRYFSRHISAGLSFEQTSASYSFSSGALKDMRGAPKSVGGNIGAFVQFWH